MHGMTRVYILGSRTYCTLVVYFLIFLGFFSPKRSEIRSRGKAWLAAMVCARLRCGFCFKMEWGIWLGFGFGFGF
jgi:hypothetical protein